MITSVRMHFKTFTDSAEKMITQLVEYLSNFENLLTIQINFKNCEQIEHKILSNFVTNKALSRVETITVH